MPENMGKGGIVFIVAEKSSIGGTGDLERSV